MPGYAMLCLTAALASRLRVWIISTQTLILLITAVIIAAISMKGIRFFRFFLTVLIFSYIFNMCFNRRKEA